MSGVLFIGEDERRIIDAAVAAARAKPTPWSVMEAVAVATQGPTLNLDERKNPERIAEIMREYPSQQVQLGTYRAAISFEEQPAGMMRHLSVSSRHPGKVPGPEVMEMVCLAFGFHEKLCKSMGRPHATIFRPERPARVWIEEFDPGHHAINIVELEP